MCSESIEKRRNSNKIKKDYENTFNVFFFLREKKTRKKGGEN